MPPPPRRQPMLNLPSVITGLIVLMVAVHAARTWLLAPNDDYVMIWRFAFIPAFFTAPLEQVPFPASRFWSPVTYALLHGDWTHLFVNLLWMVAFGSAVAKRFGSARFLVFTIFAALAGAAAHFFMHPRDIAPVIGASACVAAYMGAAARFVLGPSGLGAGPISGARQPAAMSLAQALTNRNVLIFVGVWMGLNFLFGTGIMPIAGEGAQIAWEAHVGGFLFGLLAFSFFDPVSSQNHVT